MSLIPSDELLQMPPSPPSPLQPGEVNLPALSFTLFIVRGATRRRALTSEGDDAVTAALVKSFAKGGAEGEQAPASRA